MQSAAPIPQASDSLFPQPGDEFAERYVIRALVGRGGFSRVYSAVQQDLGRPVAIKVLAPSGGNGRDRDVVEQRFYREARLASRLQGPHTVALHDYGRTPDGLLFMVSEFVQGMDLQQLLIREGALGPARSRRIFTQVIRALHEAHSRGFLHRDVKPSNIMVFDDVGERDVVKLLDFGIAKKVAGEETNLPELTLAGAVIGTQGYMAPEQALGRPLTEASDFFSAGLVGYEMLVGHSPLRGLDFTQIQRRLMTEPIRLPPTVEVDADFARVLERTLAIHPGDRYQSAAEILVALGATAPPTLPQSQATPIPRAENVQTFPMMFDTTGVTTVDTLTDAASGTSGTVELPATSVSVEQAPIVSTDRAEGPSRKLILYIIFGIALFIACVGILAAVLDFHAEERVGDDVELVAVPSGIGPAVESAADVLMRAVQNAELDAQIAAKRSQLKPTRETDKPRTPVRQRVVPAPRRTAPPTREVPETPPKRDFKVKPIDEL